MKLHLDSAKTHMNIELVNIQWYLNYTFPQHLSTIHQLTYQPEVVLRQFPGYQLIICR